MVDDTFNGEEDINFNEAELQDIMSEIEDLEKEFEPAAETSGALSLQEQIEAELQKELDQGKPVAAKTPTVEPVKVETKTVETVSAVAPTPAPAPKKGGEVIMLEKGMAPTTTTTKMENTSSSDVSFSAQGQMNLNLDFKVGTETAKLCIDATKGLVVNLKGVELCINEVTGCTVTMDNGMTFTIPLSSGAKNLKDKAA